MIASTINWLFNLCCSTNSIIHSVFFFDISFIYQNTILQIKEITSQIKRAKRAMFITYHNNFRAKINISFFYEKAVSRNLQAYFTLKGWATVAPSSGTSTNLISFAAININAFNGRTKATKLQKSALKRPLAANPRMMTWCQIQVRLAADEQGKLLCV